MAALAVAGGFLEELTPVAAPRFLKPFGPTHLRVFVFLSVLHTSP